jgi:hypothetical protein
MTELRVCSFLALGLMACGGAPPPPPAAPASSPSPIGAGAAATAGPDTSGPQAPYEDPNESAGTITMTPLFGRGAPRTFPPVTVGDIGCLGHAAISGDHAADYAAVVAACGAPAGFVEYAKPVSGKLHYVQDKRDTYALRLLGEHCYRFFAVGDRGVIDLDLEVRKKNGSHVVLDETTSPIAIIETDHPFCIDDDGDYVFQIREGATGFGGYAFGVWVRPKQGREPVTR